MLVLYGLTMLHACRLLAQSDAKNRQARSGEFDYLERMETLTELPVALPTLRAIRGTTTSLHTGVKEHYGVGRIERGDTEWLGGGKVWRSVAASVLLKQPGDVVRHLSHRGPTSYMAVTLPEEEIERVRSLGKVLVTPHLAATDERASPFHRLLDAVNLRADRLALEVAVAEAVHALVVIGGVAPEYSRPVRRALEYLRAGLSGSVTLDVLATHAGLDKFHLCRAFRAQIGMPPHQYLTHLRIARAKELLVKGVRASELAPLVGLYDQAQLTRHFRRLVGTTPARYGRTPQYFKYRGVLVR